jgi:hypothetical protein
VKRTKQYVELRPFRSRADEALEQTLEAQYRRIAIPELADLVQQRQQTAGNPSVRADEDKQLH